MLSQQFSFPLIFFVLIGISFILITIINFKKGLLLFLFLTPIIPMNISLYLGESLPLVTFQRFGLIVLSLIWISIYLLSRKSKIEKVPLLGLLSLFLLLVFIASLFSINPRASIREFFSERIIGSLLVYFIVFQIIKTKIDIKKIFYILLLSGLIVSLFGIFEYILGENPLGKIMLVPEEKLKLLGFGYERIRGGLFRIQSTFAHPIILSSYLVFLTPIILAFFLASRKKLFLGITLLANLLGIALAFSRGAWFALGIIILIVIKNKKTLTLGLILMGILMGSFFYEKSLVELPIRYKYRLWLLEGCSSAAIKNPFFGTGLTTFRDVVEVKTPGGITRTDSILYFPEILIENGIFAFTVLLFIFGKLIYRVKQASNNFLILKDKTNSNLMLFSSAGIIGILILGIFSITILNSSAGNIIFWAVAGLLIRICLISKKRIQMMEHKSTNV